MNTEPCIYSMAMAMVMPMVMTTACVEEKTRDFDQVVEVLGHEHHTNSTTDKANAPGSRRIRILRGWRKTFADEFNGIEFGEDPDCYDRPDHSLCTNRYWSTTSCGDALGPAGVDKDLNTCNWVVFNHMNWMWGSAGFNAFDGSLVEVNDGYLSLPARYNPNHGDCDNKVGDEPATTNCEVMSGGLWSRKMSTSSNGNTISNQGFEQKYGRFEIRAKIPVDEGAFPAHWLLPRGGNWPSDGEIDIMEYRPGDGVHGSFHGGRLGPPGLIHSKHHYLDDAKTVSNEDLKSNWHNYALEWDEDELRFYFDNVHYGTLSRGELLRTYDRDTDEEVSLHPALIPEMALYMILNTTVSKNDFPNEHVPTGWPGLEHKIDYVRVYEECAIGDPQCLILDQVRLRHRNTGNCAYTRTESWRSVRNKDCDPDDERLAFQIVPSGNGTVQIRNVSRNNCLYVDSGGNGGTILAKPCDGSSDQRFEINPSNTGHGFRLRHVDSNHCVYGSSSEGGKVRHWECWDDSNMEYELDVVEG